MYMEVGSQIPPLASLGRDDKRGASLALSKAPEEEGRNGVLWAEL